MDLSMKINIQHLLKVVLQKYIKIAVVETYKNNIIFLLLYQSHKLS